MLRNSGRTVKTTTLATLLAICFVTGSARAALLNPGGSLFPAPGEPDLSAGAVLLSTTGAVPFLATPPVFSGTLTSEVYRNDSTNPFGLNALTFVYRVANSQASQNAIHRLSLGGFTGFNVDASYKTPAGGLIPTLIDRPTNLVVGFSFEGAPVGPGSLAPGATTATLILQTNATLFGALLANVIDGGQANGIASLGPVVPEPASLGALVLAGGLLLRRRA